MSRRVPRATAHPSQTWHASRCRACARGPAGAHLSRQPADSAAPEKHPRDFPDSLRPLPAPVPVSAPSARDWDRSARSVLQGGCAQAQRVDAGRHSRPAPRALTFRSVVPAVAAVAIGVGTSSVRPVRLAALRRAPRAVRAPSSRCRRPAGAGEEAAGPGPRECGDRPGLAGRPERAGAPAPRRAGLFMKHVGHQRGPPENKRTR